MVDVLFLFFLRATNTRSFSLFTSFFISRLHHFPPRVHIISSPTPTWFQKIIVDGFIYVDIYIVVSNSIIVFCAHVAHSSISLSICVLKNYTWIQNSHHHEVNTDPNKIRLALIFLSLVN